MHHTFLILQILGAKTRVLTVSGNGGFINYNMAGFAYDKCTVCCHEAGDDHRGDNLFIQVYFSMLIQKRNLYACMFLF